MYKRCFFAGHSKLYEDVHEKLKAAIERQILYNGVEEFWVGNYGAFDRAAAKAVRELKTTYRDRELKTTYRDIKLYLVFPYLTRAIDEAREEYYKAFDGLLLADIPENTPLRYRILKCNEYMAQECDVLLCYVKHPFGGAAQTVEFSKKRNVEIVNISDL